MQGSTTQAPTPPKAAQPVKPVTLSGKRVVMALACWVTSGAGVLASLFLVSGTALGMLFNQPWDQVVRAPAFYSGLLVAYAWLSLVVMTRAWLADRHPHWHWVILGGLAGLISAAMLAPASLAVAPCMALGLYLNLRWLAEVGHGRLPP